VNSIDAEWWAEYAWVNSWVDGFPQGRWMRTRVLRFVGVNDGRFMFTVYPSKYWLLLSEQEVKTRYQQGTLKEFVIKGGRS
jgi:hypothetical protein